MSMKPARGICPLCHKIHGVGHCEDRPNNRPARPMKYAPISYAIVLLQEWADQIKDCHTVPETGDWGKELVAKQDYDEIISCIEALR